MGTSKAITFVTSGRVSKRTYWLTMAGAIAAPHILAFLIYVSPYISITIIGMATSAAFAWPFLITGRAPMHTYWAGPLAICASPFVLAWLLWTGPSATVPASTLIAITAVLLPLVTAARCRANGYHGAWGLIALSTALPATVYIVSQDIFALILATAVPTILLVIIGRLPDKCDPTPAAPRPPT